LWNIGQSETALAAPKHFAATLEELFRVMADGGNFGQHKIRHFNGHLFEEATVFELNDHELGKLNEAAEADWQYIEPSIMGTLFERAPEPGQRAEWIQPSGALCPRNSLVHPQ
jgi:hypothetical protein